MLGVCEETVREVGGQSSLFVPSAPGGRFRGVRLPESAAVGGGSCVLELLDVAKAKGGPSWRPFTRTN